MRYSFIIPTYNNRDQLRNTLEALNYQPDYGHYEAVVVDDGSTEDTFGFIKGINRNYDLRYMYLERNGDSCRARTRNCGWRNASGEIIVFIDSDIIIRPDYILELDRYFSASTRIAVIGTRLFIDRTVSYDDVTSGSVFSEFKFGNRRFEILEFRHFLFSLLSYNLNAINYPWMQLYSCNVAIPKNLLEDVGGFDENFKGWGIEDIELGYRLFEKKVTPMVNPRLEGLHQYHGPRNDLVIRREYIPDLDKNIGYFLTKHPEALKMGKRHAFKFLKGEASDNSHLDKEIRYINIEFRDVNQLEDLKALLMRGMKRKNIIFIVNDFIENTDLDVWIQLPKESGIINARYNPVSKKLDQAAADKFLKNERKKQKERV